MRRFKVFILVLLVLGAGFGAGIWFAGDKSPAENGSESARTAKDSAAESTQYTCGMHPFIIQDEPGTCPICGMDLTPLKAGTGGAATAKGPGERKIKHWVAPMDPTYIRDEPGKSPMGMDLVPVYEDESATGSVIEIDPVTQQNMGVRTAQVVRRDLHRTIRTVGIVEYDEPNQFSVNNKISGWVEKLYVNETGEFVKKGQPLLELYSPELVSAQEEYLLALNNREKLAESSFPEISRGAERLLESSRKRLKYWDISDRQINRLRDTGEVKKTLTLYAPYDGIISMKMAYEGMKAPAGMELFRISDISNVWINADIYEYELPWVKVGQEATVELPYKSEKIQGKIDMIYPYMEAKTRTVKARIVLENPKYELKPDMYVNVIIKAREVKDVLAVPAEAIIDSGNRKTVFVALGGGKFEPRQVKTGLRGEEGNMQVEEGLLPGEWVVTSAQFMLDSESQLREAISKMMEPKSGGPTGAEKASRTDSAADLFNDNGEAKKEDPESLFE